MNTLINFPQGPIADSSGNLSLEWFQFLQNPQVISLLVAGLTTLRGGVTVDGPVDIPDLTAVQVLESFRNVVPSQLGNNINALAIQLGALQSLNATVAKLSSDVAALKVEVSALPQFNPGALQKRLDNLAVLEALQ